MRRFLKTNFIPKLNATPHNIAATIFIFFILTHNNFSQTPEIPVRIQFEIFFKILSFDKNLKQRGAEGLKMLIVYQKKYRSSLAVFHEVDDLLQEQQIKDVNKIPITFSFVDIDESSISTAINKEGSNLIYVCPLRGIDIRDLVLLTREKNVLSFTGVADYVYDGVSVGMELKNQKPLILINLDASKEEDADFSSQLLKISKIIKE